MIYVQMCGHRGCQETETLSCGMCGVHCTCFDNFLVPVAP